MIRAFIEDYKTLKTKHPRHVRWIKGIMLISIAFNMLFIGGVLYQQREYLSVRTKKNIPPIKSSTPSTEKVVQKPEIDTQTDLNTDKKPQKSIFEHQAGTFEGKVIQRLEWIENKLMQLEQRIEAPVQASEAKATEHSSSHEPQETESTAESKEMASTIPKEAKLSFNVFKNQ
jgi:hypothetical protein